MEMKFNKKHLVAKVLFALGLGMYAAMPSAYALPSMGTLDNSRAATVTVDGKQMTIEGKGVNNVINWASFGIDKGETVKFNDKNNYLNMVYGVDISRIYGTISGGNIIYLVNPNGILFAEGTRLDNVGSFVASTRNISSINKEEFLKNPGNVEGVLGKDNTIMDNKDYYPGYSEYVPKISVADLQVTNVPASATQIILDGPGGVILKNTELLDKTTAILTRKDGGEIGIGSKDGNVSLSQFEKEKIILIDKNGNNVNASSGSINGVLKGYRAISGLEDFEEVFAKSENVMLVNDIIAPDTAFSTSLVGFVLKSTFDGMGYGIKNLQIVVPENTAYSKNDLGVFGNYRGEIRNFHLDNIHLDGSKLGFSYSTGGVAGCFNGLMSNVFVTGQVIGNGITGGLIGSIGDRQNLYNEVRNCGNYARVSACSHGIGGIIGNIYPNKPDAFMYNVYNMGPIVGYSKGKALAVGGIVGSAGNLFDYLNLETDGALTILGAVNYGDISIIEKANNSEQKAVGGILGSFGWAGKSNDFFPRGISIGESYNLGKISPSVHTDSSGDIIGFMNPPAGLYLPYSHYGDGAAPRSYYIKGKNFNFNYLYGTNHILFGLEAEESEFYKIFNKDMIGFRIYPKPGGDSSGTSGGSTGGNTSGSTGGSTGGNTGGNTGGSTGGNTGGSTGGNPGEVTKPDGDHAWKKKGYQNEIVNVTQDYINELIRKNNERQQEPPSGKITHEDSQQKNINYEEWLKNSVYEAVRNMQTSNEKNHEKLLNNKTAANESFRKLKDLITVTPSLTLDKRSEFTNDAYQAFFDFISESIANKEATKLTKDDLKKVQKTAGKIKKWISQNQETKTVNGVEYTFESTMFNAQGTSTGVVEMSWKEKNGKTHRFNVSYTDVFTDEGKEALVDYAHTMTEVGREATAKAAGEVVSAITGSRVVGKVTNRATEALMDALSNDKKASDFAKACGKDVENYVKGAPKEKLKQLISDNVAGGKEVVNAIENLLSIQK